jgi:diguanylate cyclase (GGDEF)-like protein
MPKSPRTSTGFDPSTERAQIAETLLSSAAKLISGRSEREIVQGVCDALIRTTPHIRLAWTWFGPQDAKAIQPQIWAGPLSDYAQDLTVESTIVTRMGPAFRALHGKPLEPFNISPWSVFGPWRKVATDYGIRNVLALPVHSRFSGFGGIFVLYADIENYFDLIGTGLFAALARLFSSVLTVSSEREEIEHTAHHDALTGLLNRHAIATIERRVLRVSPSDPACCVLLLDLDRFKTINDQHGHATGDLVLQAAAHALKRTVRSQDDVLRWGGEEFMICLPDTELAEALVVAEKLRVAIASIQDPLPITISIGVAEITLQQDLSQAAERADVALMLAKEAGRNRVYAAP